MASSRWPSPGGPGKGARSISPPLWTSPSILALERPAPFRSRRLTWSVAPTVPPSGPSVNTGDGRLPTVVLPMDPASQLAGCAATPGRPPTDAGGSAEVASPRLGWTRTM